MKKLISLVICVAMLFTMVVPALAFAAQNNKVNVSEKERVTVLLGDANGDGNLNAGDAVCILKHCVGIATISDPIRFIAADANQNETINSGDAVLVLHWVVFDSEPIYIEIGTNPEPSADPSANPTEEPTADPTEEPTTDPTVNPTADPTEEPTPTPTSEPTLTPSPTPTSTPTPTPTPDLPDTVYFYGNSYRGVDMQLVYSETIVENAHPMNCFNASSDKGDAVELEHKLLNDITITRTFETTGESYVFENQEYVQVVETTNWANIPGIRPVEKVAGATCANSVSLASLTNTNNSAVLGTDFSRIMYVLIEDIDWEGNLWTGIGGGGAFYTSMFYSYFDGMGYAVNRIKVRQSIDGANSNYTSTAGFFGKLNGGGVANLILPNADVRLVKTTSINMYSSVGILAAQAYSARIINCHTSGFAENLYSPWGTGGILGYSQSLYDGTHQGYCQISKCTSTVSISADRSGTAGILGKCIGPYNTIDQCWYNGMITSKSTNVGGIVGWVSDSTSPVVVTNCWSAGKYLGVGRDNDESSVVCGLIGSNKGTVSNCYTTAYIFTTAVNPMQGHPSFNAYATNTFYLTGRYYVSGTSVVNFDPVTNDFVSIDFSGYLTTGYQTLYGGTGVPEPGSLAAVVSGTVDIWMIAGAYPELINVYGHPTEN